MERTCQAFQSDGHDELKEMIEGMKTSLGLGGADGLSTAVYLVWVVTSEPLPILNDSTSSSYEISVGGGGREPLAVQKDGVVLVDQYFYEQLNTEQKAMMVIYQALVSEYLRRRPWVLSHYGTEPLRNFLTYLFQERPQNLPEEERRLACGPRSVVMHDYFVHVLSFIRDPSIDSNYKLSVMRYAHFAGLAPGGSGMNRCIGLRARALPFRDVFTEAIAASGLPYEMCEE